jgi:hypothetical protein
VTRHKKFKEVEIIGVETCTTDWLGNDLARALGIDIEWLKPIDI